MNIRPQPRAYPLDCALELRVTFGWLYSSYGWIGRHFE